MVKRLTRLIDIFYIRPLRFIPLNTFRYAAVGGVNLLLNVGLYWFCYNVILSQADTDFGIVVISAPILSFLITFVVTFFSGFWLTRSIAFAGAPSRGGAQMFRYLQVVGLNLVVNYAGLKLLVEVLMIYPSVANGLIQIVTVGFSYFMQRFYTFRGHK